MEKAHQLAMWRELRGNQMGKRLLALWMCFLIAGICIIPVKASAYPILSSWARDEAYLAEANNLYPGGGEMHDDLRCAASRGQAVWYVVQLAETLLGQEIKTSTAYVFPDMNNSFFRRVVEKAYTAGIVTGQEDGKFHETDMVTREQYITMLYRTIEFVELELGTSVLEQAQDEIPFEDSGTISPWAEEAVRTLHALGVTHGENGNVFSPRDAVSFEQMLVLSYRCLTLFRT